MILASVANSSTERLEEVQTFFLMLQRLELDSERLVSNRSLTITKGLFFVHLYGAYEHTVKETITRSIEYINGTGCSVCDLKPRLLSVALSGECDALGTMGVKPDWEKRSNLLEAASSTTPVSISTAVVPTNGKNFRYPQLESIWKTFCLSYPILPRPELGRIIGEVVDKRNAIAHGRESPITVGSRYTLNELNGKLLAMDEVCLHIVQSFEAYLIAQEFRR